MPFPGTRSAWHHLATAVILKNSFNRSWFKGHPLCEASLVLVRTLRTVSDRNPALTGFCHRANTLAYMA